MRKCFSGLDGLKFLGEFFAAEDDNGHSRDGEQQQGNDNVDDLVEGAAFLGFLHVEFANLHLLASRLDEAFVVEQVVDGVEQELLVPLMEKVENVYLLINATGKQ